MNEAETRAELIDPKLKACGWGVVEGSKVLREYSITAGKIQSGGQRAKREIADYVLVYKGIKLAVIGAKSDGLEVVEGVTQAKKYADKLQLETTYSTNGKAIYQICMKSGEEGTGATVQGVKIPFTKSLEIPFPPIKEQQTIVHQLDALRAETQKLEAVYQKKLEDLEELKKSILEKAFKGELHDSKQAE
jgi:type I site-specific restriction endonuclease